jgi:hypothetical protein
MPEEDEVVYFKYTGIYRKVKYFEDTYKFGIFEYIKLEKDKIKI